MASDDSTQPSSSTSPEASTQPTKVTLGMNWDTGMVQVQAQVHGQDTATTIQVPLEAYVSSAVALGAQLLQRMQVQQASTKKIIPARPGDLRRLQ